MSANSKAQKSVAKAPRPRAARMAPEERRKQLIDCAVKAFAQRGILDTTHADVARIAKVAIPTVFHYFSTIEILRAEVIKEVRRYLLEGFVLSRSKVDISASQRIEDMLHAFRKAVDDQPDYALIWLEWSGHTRGELWQLYTEFYHDTVKALRNLIAEGRKDDSVSKKLDAGDGARILLGTAHAIAHMRLCGSSQETARKTVHSLVNLYIAP